NLLDWRRQGGRVSLVNTNRCYRLSPVRCRWAHYWRARVRRGGSLRAVRTDATRLLALARAHRQAMRRQSTLGPASPHGSHSRRSIRIAEKLWPTQQIGSERTFVTGMRISKQLRRRLTPSSRRCFITAASAWRRLLPPRRLAPPRFV